MKKVTAAALCGLAVVGSMNSEIPAYAAQINVSKDSIKEENARTSQLVYVQDGEGDKGSGTGKEDSPYQNIRTALKEIKDGQTLVLVGEVAYTKYEEHTDKSALPLFIDKNIKIEGKDGNSSLKLRAPIQLGADVEFSNFKLNMVTPTIMGDGSQGNTSGIFGDKDMYGMTIYAAGHSLTLNNVDTTLGEAPFISAGRFKGQGELGDKAIINISSSKYDCEIERIYCGDYSAPIKMDVDINLNRINTDLYTGGLNNQLDGNVTVSFFGDSNLNNINKENHKGNLNYVIERGCFTANKNFNGIDKLTLEEGSKINLTDEAVFNVNDVELMKNATIDFSFMKTPPEIKGNFIGVANESDAEGYGKIVLNSDQTLNITGKVSGTTIISSKTGFVAGGQCVIAGVDSDGDFIIDKEASGGRFYLEKNNDENKTTWTVNRSDKKIKDFAWIDGEDIIKNPELDNNGLLFGIEFRDDENNIYNPYIEEILNQFSCTLTASDGSVFEAETPNVSPIDLYYSDDNGFTQLIIYINDSKYLDGEMKIVFKHLETQKEIVKTIKFNSDSEDNETKPDPKPPIVDGGEDNETEKPPITDGGEGNESEKPQQPPSEINPNPGDDNPEDDDSDNEEDKGEGQPPSDKDESDGGNDGSEDEEDNNPPPSQDEEDKDDTSGEGGSGEQKPAPKPEDKPEEIVKPTDFSKLKVLYDKCIAANYKRKDYVSSTFDKYEKELNNAKSVLRNEKATQEEVDKAYKDLSISLNGLKKITSSSGGGSGSSGGSGGGSGSSGGSGGGSGSGSSNGDSSEKNDNNSAESGSTVEVDKNLTDVNKPGAANKEENNKTNWNLSNGNWTITASDGTLVKGWHKDEASGKWYMLDRNTGNMVTGWTKDIDGKWYHLNNNGEMSTGWIKDATGKWYHLSESGAMSTGWIKDTSGKWYHLNETGAMNTGWLKDTNGKWYLLNESGAMVTGWHKDTDGKWYYLNSDGSMAANTTIDGYKIGNDGAWIK